MNASLVTRPGNRRGFTLIELLVVISIIAVLAGLLLPVLAKAKEKAQIAKARVEINGILGAISKYEADYGRLPAHRGARDSIDNVNNPDMTYGTRHLSPSGQLEPLRNKKGIIPPVINNDDEGRYQNSNSEVMAALLDIERFRNGSPTWNLNHAMNPKKTIYLTVKETSDITSPGVGLDGVYRDPWGSPYIITLDLNGDNKTRDAHYRKTSVSKDPSGGPDKGLNGLYNPTGAANAFEANKPILVWSLGPDGLIDNGPANRGANRDNILSW